MDRDCLVLELPRKSLYFTRVKMTSANHSLLD